MKRFLLARSSNNLTVILLSTALGASVAGLWRGNSAHSAPPESRTISVEQKQMLTTLQDAFAGIAEQVEPYVVTVTARAKPVERPEPRSEEERARPRRGFQPGDRDLPFGFPFDFRDLVPPSGDGEEGPNAPPSMGSGVMIREDGKTVYVLTNNHVVRGRDRLHVELRDGSEYGATLVGADERSDLAVLKFTPARPLPPNSVAPLGDSDRARVGEWVMAVGSPLGYESTLTVGVVSAKGRALRGPGGPGGPGQSRGNYTDLIQTDASINPGNSGGPLVNIHGEVIGINVAIAPGAGGGNIGIGFAIPTSTARGVAEQLIAHGKVTRGFLGVQVSEQNRELEPELKEFLKVDGGALVEGVSENSPAARGGLKAGDVIVRFGDRSIRSFIDLEKVVSNVAPGTTVAVDAIRDGKPVSLKVTLMERPADADQGQPRRTVPGRSEGTRSKFGLTVRQGEGGVQVVQVAPGSIAEDSRVAPGDTVVAVGKTPVSTVEEFQKAVNALGDEKGCIFTMKDASGLRYCVIRP